MNETFASEPMALHGHMALKFLLEKFGPLTGRYLAAYPKDWKEQVEKLNAELGDVELERVKTLLRRAKDDMRVIGSALMPFNEKESWLTNTKKLLESKPKRHLTGVVIAPRTPPELHHDVYEIGDLQLPPTAEERITTTPEEFTRVSHVLLLTSPEIGFIDPFINPCDRYVQPILGAMIELAAKGRCYSIRLWARASAVLSKNTLEDVRVALNSLVPSETRNKLRIELNLLDDDRCTDRMHGRYLLSVKGGIRFDQGFQQLPKGRKVDVSPLSSKEIFTEIWRTYFEDEHAFPAACKPIVITRIPSSSYAT